MKRPLMSITDECFRRGHYFSRFIPEENVVFAGIKLRGKLFFGIKEIKDEPSDLFPKDRQIADAESSAKLSARLQLFSHIGNLASDYNKRHLKNWLNLSDQEIEKDKTVDLSLVLSKALNFLYDKKVTLIEPSEASFPFMMVNDAEIKKRIKKQSKFVSIEAESYDETAKLLMEQAISEWIKADKDTEVDDFDANADWYPSKEQAFARLYAAAINACFFMRYKEMEDELRRPLS